jgi:hypothetical protein
VAFGSKAALLHPCHLIYFYVPGKAMAQMKPLTYYLDLKFTALGFLKVTF